MFPFSKKLLLGFAVLSSLGVFDVKADIFTTCGIDLGAAGRTKKWAVFTLNGGVVQDDLSGSSYIGGDVGVAGSGNIKMSGGSTIQGDLWYRSNGTLTMSGGTVTGTKYHDAAHDAVLDQGVIDAMNASAAAFSHPVTPAYSSITKINTGNNYNLNISGQGCVVLKLTDLVLTGGTFTLTGTATDALIVNVTKNFTISGGAKIVLSGGITWDSVLFNVVNTGSDIAISGSSKFTGILLGTKRTVKLSGSTIDRGMVIANKLVLSGGARITNPYFISP